MEQTDDMQKYGDVIVYCKQHLRPHRTGWCTVSLTDKVKLDASTLETAYVECETKGYKLFQG